MISINWRERVKDILRVVFYLNCFIDGTIWHPFSWIKSSCLYGSCFHQTLSNEWMIQWRNFSVTICLELWIHRQFFIRPEQVMAKWLIRFHSFRDNFFSGWKRCQHCGDSRANEYLYNLTAVSIYQPSSSNKKLII